jgi:hypothetical protein
MQPSLPSVLRNRARRLAFTLRPLPSFFAASAVELSEGFQGRSNPLPQRTQRKDRKDRKGAKLFLVSGKHFWHNWSCTHPAQNFKDNLR